MSRSGRETREVTATRTLRYVRGPRVGQAVTIRLFGPYPYQTDPPHQYKIWACDFEIDGLVEKIEMQTHGGDSMQALMIAIQGISQDIKPEASYLSWEYDGDLGPPGEIGIPFSILFASGLNPGTTFSTVELQEDVERALEDYERRMRRMGERFSMDSDERPRPFATIDHVQLAMPLGREEQARQFYSGILGMSEIEKPDALKERGGAWFGSGITHIHLGVDPDFAPAKKAHPALRCRKYAALIETLVKAGVEVRADPIPLPDGSKHAYIDDPFGNRIELIEET